MMKFTGLNHLAMVTADMGKTIRFWRDLLGMRLIVGIGKSGYRIYFFEISKGECIAFFEWPDVNPIPEKDAGVAIKGSIAFDHVSFGVETEDDLWKIRDKLDAVGLWVSEIIDHGFIHSIYTFDPNGISVEFSHNVEGIDVHKDTIMADLTPSPFAREGSDPQIDKWPQVQKPTPLDERKTYPGFGSDVFSKKKG
jgi:catechol 2,3-dioxygenase-like lactoylglutathione lyase family enzyme